MYPPFILYNRPSEEDIDISPFFFFFNLSDFLSPPSTLTAESLSAGQQQGFVGEKTHRENTVLCAELEVLTVVVSL